MENNDPTMNIGKSIMRIRKSYRLTQAQFGEVIGKSQSTVYGYENGTIIPPFSVLLLISSVFNVSLATVMGLDDLKEPETDTESLRKIYDFYVRSCGGENE